jgi:DNA-binding GntR family transcriptional regulator
MLSLPADREASPYSGALHYALDRPLFLFLAHTRQLAQSANNSNASTWAHRQVVEWLREHDQENAAEAMAAQPVQWTLIQSKGL